MLACELNGVDCELPCLCGESIRPPGGTTATRQGSLSGRCGGWSCSGTNDGCDKGLPALSCQSWACGISVALAKPSGLMYERVSAPSAFGGICCRCGDAGRPGCGNAFGSGMLSSVRSRPWVPPT